ncbi:hypothetical protein Scep_005958 [Stephania cephalantha]|uniref:Uncharacterized protein n=1 Tax=Stephania cephalantha TaxID=152367 RepID=A0AAP0K768_9MAGN
MRREKNPHQKRAQLVIKRELEREKKRLQERDNKRGLIREKKMVLESENLRDMKRGHVRKIQRNLLGEKKRGMERERRRERARGKRASSSSRVVEEATDDPSRPIPGGPTTVPYWPVSTTMWRLLYGRMRFGEEKQCEKK